MSGMKIPNSVHGIYEINVEFARQIKNEVGKNLEDLAKQRGWFFTDRIKSEESFCQKIESGRFDVEFNPVNLKNQVGDLYAATMAVQNIQKVREAVGLVTGLPYIHLKLMKPHKLDVVYHKPSEFVYDGVRLYFTTSQPLGRDKPDTSFMLFEIQIKTFLDYAWGFSTHDIGYKGDSFEWGVSRIVAQNKAVLDSVELSISEYAVLAKNQAVSLENKEFKDNQDCLLMLKNYWKEFPDDGITLTRNINNLKRVLGITNQELSEIIQRHLAYEYMSLSVYGCILKALIIEMGVGFFDKISEFFSKEEDLRNKIKIVIYKEINIEDLIAGFLTIKDQYSDYLIMV